MSDIILGGEVSVYDFHELASEIKIPIVAGMRLHLRLELTWRGFEDERSLTENEKNLCDGERNFFWSKRSLSESQRT